MTTVDLLPASAVDVALLLALNNAHQTETSFLEQEALQSLIEGAFHAVTIPTGDALLIAFDQTADYESPNFRWFKERYDRFAYVDRIIVGSSARGQGLARRLYEGLFSVAEAHGHPRVVCEVHKMPPNPGSDAFHAALGFEIVGEAEIHGGQKTVRYMERRLG